MRFALVFVVVSLALAGCAQNAPAPSSPSKSPTFDGENWPRLDGVTLTILDHGAFGAFSDASARFENLTGARVVQVSANDAGGALARAVLEKGNPTFDVIYGIDNILWTKAVEEGVFEPYKPVLADRIAPEYVFFDANGSWFATPVDHGYIAVNVDPRVVPGGVASLADVRAHASQFVTEDPRTSTPGLGFLLATIATYPDSWQDYWSGLFENGALVTSGWTEAYEQHFSGGYGVDYGGKGDRGIVTSYTTSPAYEAFFGRSQENLSVALTAPNGTFHQIETMGIAKGTKNLAAAKAWIEFSLTPGFQNLTAPSMAVYPVTLGEDVSGTFAGVDPAPGSFQPAMLSTATIGQNIESWVGEWTALCEAASCA